MEDGIIKSFSAYSYSDPEPEVDETVVEEAPVEETVVEEAVEAPKPKRKTTSRKKTQASSPKKEEKPSQVAVYSDGKLAHPALGRLVKGYNIVSPEAADEWMKISKKVRLATPDEVAAAYEV